MMYADITHLERSVSITHTFPRLAWVLQCLRWCTPARRQAGSTSPRCATRCGAKSTPVTVRIFSCFHNHLLRFRLRTVLRFLPRHLCTAHICWKTRKPCHVFTSFAAFLTLPPFAHSAAEQHFRCGCHQLRVFLRAFKVSGRAGGDQGQRKGRAAHQLRAAVHDIRPWYFALLLSLLYSTSLSLSLSSLSLPLSLSPLSLSTLYLLSPSQLSVSLSSQLSLNSLSTLS